MERVSIEITENGFYVETISGFIGVKKTMIFTSISELFLFLVHFLPNFGNEEEIRLALRPPKEEG